MDETSPETSRRIGRGVFLATVAGGVSSLLWGRPASRIISSGMASSGFEKLCGSATVKKSPHGWLLASVLSFLRQFAFED